MAAIKGNCIETRNDGCAVTRLPEQEIYITEFHPQFPFDSLNESHWLLRQSSHQHVGRVLFVSMVCVFNVRLDTGYCETTKKSPILADKPVCHKTA